MSSSRAETGATVLQAVVGSGRGGRGWDADGVLGGGTDRGGGGYGWDRNGCGPIIRWDYTVANVILGTKPNATLDFSPGLESQHPIMSMLGGHRGRLDREICQNLLRLKIYQHLDLPNRHCVFCIFLFFCLCLIYVHYIIMVIIYPKRPWQSFLVNVQFIIIDQLHHVLVLMNTLFGRTFNVRD